MTSPTKIRQELVKKIEKMVETGVEIDINFASADLSLQTGFKPETVRELFWDLHRAKRIVITSGMARKVEDEKK